MEKSKNTFRKIAAAMILAMGLSSFNVAIASGIVPDAGKDSGYEYSSWLDNADYKVTWNENSNRAVTKGEFILAELRTVISSQKRRQIDPFTGYGINIKNKADVPKYMTVEEARLMVILNFIKESKDEYKKLSSPIKRSEAAKVLCDMNRYFLIDPLRSNKSARSPKVFTDIKGNSYKDYINKAYESGLIDGATDTTFNPNGAITIKDTLNILEREIGKYGITRSDIAKAMNSTFKIVIKPDLSIGINNVINEQKMRVYQFDRMYNNGSAKASEPVTKAEALKLVLAATLNTDNISDIAITRNEYPNATWVGYAKSWKITTEDINISNYNDKAEYMDVIMYLERYKKLILKDKPIKETEVNFEDISTYSAEEQEAIKDMVANGIISPSSDNLKGNEYITKGQLNELVINTLEKYNTLAMKGDTINTNPDNTPSNAGFYPYTLSNIDKSVYEIPPHFDWIGFITAKEMYQVRKDLFPKVKRWTEAFYSSILNIDYKTITEEGLYNSLKPYLGFRPNAALIKQYVKYVKDNQIVIEGNVKFQDPILYNDAMQYRARLRMTFDIRNSKTKDNLLYFDWIDQQHGFKETYTKNSYDILIDCPLSDVLNSRDLSLQEEGIYNMILNKDKCGIIRTSVKK